ncbi:hypothetical protein GH714_019542 [Hevea brasiliensis]|uniref:anthocyanidin 3-O-glucosyltransferase n=1 Tax=Hevea brasiliensis TaxID=3981 RepID=A0A6A6N5M7_HEVBR|nr:hypothetical protein GH714_019542 [Hevea brasiliensis]
MDKAQLVFVPFPVMGHLVSAVEVAKLLLTRDHRLSITVLILELPLMNSKIQNYIESVQDSSSSLSNRLRFIDLPKDESELSNFASFFERQKANVKEAVLKITQSESSVDSPHLQKIHDEEKFDPIQFKEKDTELLVTCLANPFPARVMPSGLSNKERLPHLLDSARRFREVKGIMSNGRNTHQEIMQWLDAQPVASVVFLCFGSMGSFGKDQLKEIACALEHSGYRFLWSVRRPPPPAKLASPSDYENPQEVLPEGFLERTAAIGKVIGWAPQAAILAHPAVGGFVSHCGWNSVLESLWFGVPIATWPMYAEQQFNAFEMVIELGLAVEIKMEYSEESGMMVNCDEIERGIRCLMENDSEKRKKVKEMSKKSRMALIEGVSSYYWLGRLVEYVMDNLA